MKTRNILKRKFLLMGGAFFVALIVLFTGRIIAIDYANGRYVNWVDIGFPPEPIGSIEAVSFTVSPGKKGRDASLFITAIDGTLYQGSHTICANNKNCWQKAERIPEKVPSSNFQISDSCENSYKNAADPPSIVTVCVGYEDRAPGSHLSRTAHFALLNNGSIWVWEFIPGMKAGIIFLIASVVASLSAIVFFIVVRKPLVSAKSELTESREQ